MTDEDIPRLLHDAVDDIEPRGEVSDIRAAIDQRDGRTTWVRGALAAAAAVVLVTGGAAYLHHRAGSGVTPVAGRTVEATVYYVGRTAVGPRLFSETHELTDVKVSDVQAAVDTVLSTPTDPDYHSAFATGTSATVTDGADGVVDIDLSSGVRLADGADAEAALQSLVWTVDAALQRQAPVHVTIGGKVPAELFGAPAKQSYAKAAQDDILSPVSIDLTDGAEITAGTTINGHAAAFEADVTWTLRQGAAVIRHGFTTANECCTLSPFSFTVDAPAGVYTLTVSDTDPSDGEGNGVTTDTKTIQID